MRVAVDVGVLARAYAGTGEDQRRAADALERVLADGALVISVATLVEMIDLVTDADLFENAPSLSAVTDLCREYATASNVEIADVHADDLVAALALLRERVLTANELSVALLAAGLRRLGVTRLLTADPDAYLPFGFIDAVDVREPAAGR